ncbi:zinc ribbon domain-containing protein [Solidesulfovibrio sp. C21]|uniref:zinc ribbon domain-containing protein n=1 Tax=Solidesulfovibrio sp. C21 TaxID=3398613 RepID=UPI0039FD79A5
MALVKCPECGHEISDKAEACPHCGYEVVQESWAIRKSICANVSWYVFVGEILVGASILLWLSKESSGNTQSIIIVLTLFTKTFGWIFKVTSLIGILFAVASLARKEPKKVLAWVCVVLHGAGLIG